MIDTILRENQVDGNIEKGASRDKAHAFELFNRGLIIPDVVILDF